MLRREEAGGSNICYLFHPDLPTLSKSRAESRGLFLSALEPVLRRAVAAIRMIEKRVLLVAALGERIDRGREDLSFRFTGFPVVGGLGDGAFLSKE